MYVVGGGVVLMTPWLIRTWILAYIATAIVAAVERRWPWCLYYIAAALISVAVLWMGQKT